MRDALAPFEYAILALVLSEKLETYKESADGGIFTVFILVVLKNAPSPIVVKEVNPLRSRVANASHPLNALLDIVVNDVDLLRSSVVNLLQLRKALPPIETNERGKISVVK